MARVKIDLPEKFSFTTLIPVRITDVNYGGHVGNDAILSILHEVRIQYLLEYGYTEMNLGGVGVIMKDVAIEFKKELFYGEIVRASVASTAFTNVSFDICYKLEKQTENDTYIPVALAKTGMVSYDYEAKKVVSLSEAVKKKLSEG